MTTLDAPLTDAQASIAAAFDSLAPRYDEAWTRSVVGILQREAFWRTMDRHFLPGQLVLELGGGTGIDAVHLAKRGIRVHTIDISPEMVRAARARVASEALSDAVSVELCAIENLSSLHLAVPFDGAFSSFGAVNCVGDLRRMSRDLGERMRRGAKLILCCMGRFCLWESVWYLVRGRASKAFRRMSGSACASLGSGPMLHVRFPKVSVIAEALKSQFHLTSVGGIGIFVPPSCAEDLARAIPGIVRILSVSDRMVGGLPVFRALSDHRVLVFVRR